jgi:transposase
LDETGFQTSAERVYGWSFPGRRILDYRCGLKRKFCNLIGGYLNNKLIAPLLFYASCTAKVFNDWLSEHLLPLLKPGTVIVMDNARFHKSDDTRKFIEKAKCRLLFLPPYSPHLNPIEKLWGNMKLFRRNHPSMSVHDIVESYRKH